jgi:hypothetical protein
MRNLELLLSSSLFPVDIIPAAGELAAPQNDSSRQALSTLPAPKQIRRAGAGAPPRNDSSWPCPIHLSRIDSWPILPGFRRERPHTAAADLHRWTPPPLRHCPGGPSQTRRPPRHNPALRYGGSKSTYLVLERPMAETSVPTSTPSSG